MTMTSHENINSGNHPNNMQSFKVFRDTSHGPSLQLESPGESICRLEDDLDFATQSDRPPPSPHQSFVCDSPTLPRLDGTNDVLRDGKVTITRGRDKASANHVRSPLASPETIVLAKNTLKVNLSPRTVSAKGLHEPAQTKPSSRNKRRLLQEDCDHQYPQKSPKLRYATSNHDKDSPARSEDKYQPHVSTEAQENSLDSIISSQISKFQKGNSTIDDQPSAVPVDTQKSDTTNTDNVEEPQEKSFTTFNGDVTTPRSSAMYNFNSAMRLLNPFKAVGNLFGRLSATQSPSKPQTLSSEEIARQVDSHLQRFEDKLFDRLAAFRAAGESTHDITSPMMLDVSSPLISDIDKGPNKHSVTGLGISPYKSAIDLSPAVISSPLAPVSQFKSTAIHRHDLREPRGMNGNGFRNSSGALLQSPTERRSKGGKSPLKQEDLMNPFEASVEAPRLRNKASQHLKKMASKMNLRGRKSKANDEIPINNDDYRVMKRKNKDEILRDYITLQKEKEELERQLAVKIQPSEREEVIDVVAPIISTSNQTKTEPDSANITPVLLDSTTPNLRVKQKRSNSLDPDDAEQTRTKRRTVTFAPTELPLSSPLASMNESVSGARLSQLESSKSTQIRDEGTEEKDQLTADTKSDLGQASHVVKKVPPVPTVPSKYRSKVPRPSREGSRVRKSESDWKGWDAEVF